jgi:YD repeat-containing protein
MAAQFVYDDQGQLIGRMETTSDGTVWVYDASGNLLGRATRNPEATFDASGNRVANSFVPGMLIKKR